MFLSSFFLLSFSLPSFCFFFFLSSLFLPSLFLHYVSSSLLSNLRPKLPIANPTHTNKTAPINLPATAFPDQPAPSTIPTCPSWHSRNPTKQSRIPSSRQPPRRHQQDHRATTVTRRRRGSLRPDQKHPPDLAKDHRPPILHLTSSDHVAPRVENPTNKPASSVSKTKYEKKE